MKLFTRVGMGAGLTMFALSACGAQSATDPDISVATSDAGVAATTIAPASQDDAASGPVRIVSLSPTHTEMLFAIGAGDQVIAVDDFSNYPAEADAKRTDLSGYEPNIEAIAGYEPDLVITDGTNQALIEQLGDLGIAVWSGPAAASFDDVYNQIAELGEITGRSDTAAALIDEMQTEIAEIDASLPEQQRGLTYYHELDPSLFSITSDTFIGSVYSALGLRSIADTAEGSAGAYPQLNAEFILDADPDLVFLACTKYCGETIGSVAARPGWESLGAVQDGLVFEMDDDIASRWGPRIVDYYRSVADAIRRAVGE